jgi:hypothetical protein
MGADTRDRLLQDTTRRLLATITSVIITDTMPITIAAGSRLERLRLEG